jgi:hypothetical protein
MPEMTHDEMSRMAQGQKALRTLREIHFFLWPERYPAKKARTHGYWDGYEDCYQWNSDTIQAVSEMVARALADDPATPKGGDS